MLEVCMNVPPVLMSGPVYSLLNDSELVWGIKRAFKGSSVGNYSTCLM